MKKLLGVCFLMVAGSSTAWAEGDLDITSPSIVTPEAVEEKLDFALPQVASPQLKALHTQMTNSNQSYLQSAERLSNALPDHQNVTQKDLDRLRLQGIQLQKEIYRLIDAEEEFLIQRYMEEADATIGSNAQADSSTTNSTLVSK